MLSWFYPPVPMPEIVNRVEGHRISTIPPADLDDVLRDQLEWLIENPVSERYGRVREILLEPFSEPPKVMKAGR